MTGRALLPCLLALAGPACQKAPIYEIGAGFALADASWFAEEETLFVFYEMSAQQGLGEASVIEISWTTDEERVDWTPLHELPMVHTHLPIDCGPDGRCGSASLHVPMEPRRVQLRLRYHRDGQLALEPQVSFNVVDAGPAYSHRSFVVYGVFDETNERIQWRGRHQFPTLRNEQAEELGLRRAFRVAEPRYGSVPLATGRNVYGYGITCPESLTPADLEPVATLERAIFHPEPLPVEAGVAPLVCAEATVSDATGLFTTGAVARKNPEVRPAFPLLRSPVRDATQIGFFVGPCERAISTAHEVMQRQRLGLEGVPTTCTEGWQQPGFVDELAGAFRDAIEAERPVGHDMVLVVAVHREEGDGVAEAVEQALLQVVPAERHRTTPRVAGAFVLDSTIRGLALEELEPVTLWCPADMPLADLPDASQRACATMPDVAGFDFGPFSVGQIPILPSRDQYLDFIDTYTIGQAGEVLERQFLAPEFSATAEHVDLGEFGVVTFLDDEFIDAAPEDAFSYCPGDTPELVVFRSEILRQSVPYGMCEELGLPPETCEGALPLSFLPEWHAEFGERSYDLGLFWEFPFLLRLEYELPAAIGVTAFGFTVPFGANSVTDDYYGTPVWTSDGWPLDDKLTQCVRFCDHPTFDSAGVYHVSETFRGAYAHACYRPDYPEPGDGGFPRDP